MSNNIESEVRFKAERDNERKALLFFNSFVKKHLNAIKIVDREYYMYWQNDENTIVFILDPTKLTNADMAHFVVDVARFSGEAVSVEELPDGTFAYNIMVRFKRYTKKSEVENGPIVLDKMSSFT